MNRLFIILLILVFACSISYSQSDNTKPIRDAINNWVDGFNSGDYSKAISIYSDDFIGYYPNQKNQYRKDIEDQYKHILNNKNLSVIISFKADEIDVSGDFAYVRMTMTAKIKPIYAPEPSMATDKGLQVWKKDKSSGWKIIRSSSFPANNENGKMSNTN